MSCDTRHSVNLTFLFFKLLGHMGDLNFRCMLNFIVLACKSVHPLMNFLVILTFHICLKYMLSLGISEVQFLNFCHLLVLFVK